MHVTVLLPHMISVRTVPVLSSLQYFFRPGYATVRVESVLSLHLHFLAAASKQCFNMTRRRDGQRLIR